MSKSPLLALLVLFLAISIPIQAFAASTAKFSPSVKAAFDKVVSVTTAPLQANLSTQYSFIQSLQNEDLEVEQAILNIRNTNEKTLLSINTRMKQLDTDKMDKLQKQVTEAKKRYKPLFDLRTSLNKQISVAKKLKNKQLTTALQTQLGIVSLSAQLAREEIRMKEAAYSKAKDGKTKTIKEVRNILAEADPVKLKIRVEKSAAVQTGKLISSENKNFTAIVKKADPAGTLTSLTSLVALSRQLVNQKTSISNLEKKIGLILEKANNLLPAA